MKVARLKWEVLDFTGYVFCEFTFRWFDRFDIPWDEDEWRWYHHVNNFIGAVPYRVGCFFYSLQDDEAAGVTLVEADEDEDESW